MESLFNHSSTESESELLYDWRFAANLLHLAPSPLRLTTDIFTSQETHYISVIKTSRLILFIMRTIRKKQIHCEQNSEIWYVKAGGIYSNHWALKG
jgi:hypothetical protein